MITVDGIRHLPTITAAQTAELFGVADVDTVTAALRRGDLPGVKVGNKWCVPVDRLLAMIERDGRFPDGHQTAVGPLSLRPLADLLIRAAEALLAAEGAGGTDGRSGA
jgi:hypothetical protein